MRILRAHGMATSTIHVIFNPVVVAKLTYATVVSTGKPCYAASSWWWGFTMAEDRLRLEDNVMHAIKRETVILNFNNNKTSPDVTFLRDFVYQIIKIGSFFAELFKKQGVIGLLKHSVVRLFFYFFKRNRIIMCSCKVVTLAADERRTDATFA